MTEYETKLGIIENELLQIAIKTNPDVTALKAVTQIWGNEKYISCVQVIFKKSMKQVNVEGDSIGAMVRDVVKAIM